MWSIYEQYGRSHFGKLHWRDTFGNFNFMNIYFQSYAKENKQDVEIAARKLSELVRTNLTPVTALSAVIEVKVHTLFLGPSAGK